MITSILSNYPGYTTGFSNITISDNHFNDSGDAFCNQAYNSGYAIPNLVFNGNTVTDGSLLGGAFLQS